MYGTLILQAGVTHVKITLRFSKLDREWGSDLNDLIDSVIGLSILDSGILEHFYIVVSYVPEVPCTSASSTGW